MAATPLVLPPECLPEQAVTAWDGNVNTDPKRGIRVEAALKKSIHKILFVNPQEVYVHATPLQLVEQGEEGVGFLKKYLPTDTKVSFAIAGDADSPKIEGYHDHWENAAALAVKLELSAFQPNTESRWAKFGPSAMEAAMASLQPFAESLTLTHTSFPGPVNVPVPGTKGKQRWGYGQSYPYKQAVGKKTKVRRTYPQTYFATADGELRARGAYEFVLKMWGISWRAAIKLGIIPADLPVGAYLQAYGCRTDDLCTMASCFGWTQWWAYGTRCGPEGLVAGAAMAKLFRLGKTITQFQAENGLKVDRIVGPKTLEALGIDVSEAVRVCG